MDLDGEEIVPHLYDGCLSHLVWFGCNFIVVPGGFLNQPAVSVVDINGKQFVLLVGLLLIWEQLTVIDTVYFIELHVPCWSSPIWAGDAYLVL